MFRFTATPPEQPQRCILTDSFNNYNGRLTGLDTSYAETAF